ncbi:hypothetical protein ADK34_32725 [Streptomyces viridochromogenes]|uniref:Uncharacterized protein n=1 Tax=Streptomyces viridochromogenes TaxID=1938 RepID=A0A0L8JF75_STRVR|nr:hypothetical protein ADK34_32725 [Streptomyces viridochromogenes]
MLRTELRRSVAPSAGGVLVLLTLGFLYLISGPWEKGPTMWTAQWTSMALWTRFLLVFLWPLAVGFGALQGMRDHRSGMTELLATTSRPPLSRAVRTAGASALTLTAAFACPVLLGAIHVHTSDGHWHTGWLPLSLVGALSLVAGSVFGMGMGKVAPSALTPPLLAAAALMGTLTMQQAQDPMAGERIVPLRFALLSPANGPVRDVLTTFSASVHAGQVIWLAGLGTTGVALLVAARRRARLAAVSSALAAGVIALAVLPPTSSRTYVVDTVMAAPQCNGRVCVTRAHSSRLPDLVGPAYQALRIMRERLGDQAPLTMNESTVQQAPGTVRPRSRTTLFLYFDDWSVTHARGTDLVRSLIASGLAPTCLSPEDGSRRKIREIAAQSVAVAWATGELEPLPGTLWSRDEAMALAQPVWETLHSRPEQEQRSKIDAMRRAAFSCQGDPLGALTKGGQP